MPLLGLILLVVSFFAAKQVPGRAQVGRDRVRADRRSRWPWRCSPSASRSLGALHGINALAVFGTAVRASMLARERPRAAAATGGAYDVPQQASGSSAPEASRPVN